MLNHLVTPSLNIHTVEKLVEKSGSCTIDKVVMFTNLHQFTYIKSESCTMNKIQNDFQLKTESDIAGAITLYLHLCYVRFHCIWKYRFIIFDRKMYWAEDIVCACAWMCACSKFTSARNACAICNWTGKQAIFSFFYSPILPHPKLVSPHAYQYTESESIHKIIVRPKYLHRHTIYCFDVWCCVGYYAKRLTHIIYTPKLLLFTYQNFCWVAIFSARNISRRENAHFNKATRLACFFFIRYPFSDLFWLWILFLVRRFDAFLFSSFISLRLLMQMDLFFNLKCRLFLWTAFSSPCTFAPN